MTEHASDTNLEVLTDWWQRCRTPGAVSLLTIQPAHTHTHKHINHTCTSLTKTWSSKIFKFLFDFILKHILSIVYLTIPFQVFLFLFIQELKTIKDTFLKPLDLIFKPHWPGVLWSCCFVPLAGCFERIIFDPSILHAQGVATVCWKNTFTILFLCVLQGRILDLYKWNILLRCNCLNWLVAEDGFGFKIKMG